MDLLISIALVVAGLVIVLFFSERLVKGTAGLASSLSLSAFLLSVVFLGFDPENLAVGAIGSFEDASGIALGSIIGSAMVAIALSFGVAVLAAPMRFGQVPKQILAVPVAAVLLFGALALDGRLSRLDGGILLAGYAFALVYLLWLSRRGIDIQASSEVSKELGEAKEMGTWKALGWLALALAAIIVGAELLVTGTKDLIARFGLSQTIVGMTALALAVSVEELARTVPAAIKGRPEISYGTVNGSVLAFFLFNAGVIALVSPIGIDRPTLLFYLPIAAAAVVAVSLLLLNGRVPRWAGGVLVALYVGFALGGYLLFSRATPV